MLKWDGHTHTRFCYHGSDAPQELYLDRAVELGFQRYTISEHPPLPANWIDDAKLMDELAMSLEEMPEYLAYAKEMKRRYVGKLEVAIGLEIDYLPGAGGFTEQLLERFGSELEDVVYSVHYLPGVGGMRCIDYTVDDFKEHLLAHYGSMDRVADEYYNHVEAAIREAAKLPMRKRIGHINLIEKFRTELPEISESLIRSRLEGLLPLLETTGVGVDVNTAGQRVPTCGKAYVPEWFIKACAERGIECVYGSDSHKPEQVGFGYEWFEKTMARG